MARNDPSPEQRDDALLTLAREKTAAMLASIRAGQPQATKLVVELLGDYLNDENAITALVRESLAGTNSLYGAITDLIWTECDQLAQAELADRERTARQLADDDRIARHLDAQAA